ncbi:MAG: twin-arginine translocase subunit TatC [Pseudomonadota bacterium]
MKILDALSTVFKKGVARKAERQRAIENSTAGTVQNSQGGGGSAGGEMSIVAHISELRKHIVRALYWYLAFMVIAFVNMKMIIRFLQLPYTCYSYLISQANQAGESLQQALQKFSDFVNWPSHCLTAAAASSATAQNLKTIGLIEVMWVNMKMCLIAAGVLGLPFILRELWLFVSPALYERERKMAVGLVIASLVLFYVGIFFGFFVIVPAFLSQTLQWAAEYASVEMTYENYFGSLTTLVMIFGVIFQVPVVVTLLGFVGLVKSSHITGNRKIIFLASFILGAIISPPDVFSQVLVSVPLYLMCEISVFALRAIERSRAVAAVQSESSPPADTP